MNCFQGTDFLGVMAIIGKSTRKPRVRPNHHSTAILQATLSETSLWEAYDNKHVTERSKRTWPMWMIRRLTSCVMTEAQRGHPCGRTGSSACSLLVIQVSMTMVGRLAGSIATSRRAHRSASAALCSASMQAALGARPDGPSSRGGARLPAPTQMRP